MVEWAIIVVAVVLLATGVVYALCLHRSVQERLRPLQAKFLPLCMLFIAYGLMMLVWALGGFDSSPVSLFILATAFYAVIAFFVAQLNQTIRSSTYAPVITVLYVAALGLSLFRVDIALPIAAFCAACFIFLSSIALLRNLYDHLAYMSLANSFGAAFMLAALIVHTISGYLPLAYYLAPLFFLVSALTLRTHLAQCSYEVVREKHVPPRSIVFANAFFFVAVLVVFSFVLTITIHEVGHAIVARAVGCSESRVIYNLHEYPFTESMCRDTDPSVIYAAGAAATTLVSLLLMLVRPSIARYMGFFIGGLGFFFAYDDLVRLQSPKVVFALFLFGSLALCTWGLIRLCVYAYACNTHHHHQKVRSVTCTAITD